MSATLPDTFDTTYVNPFSTTPDPGLLYLTPSLKTVVHKARFVIQRRQGVTAILGAVGLGKSTVLRYIAGQYLTRDDVVSAYIPTPNFPSDFAFLRSLCNDLGIPMRRSMVTQEAELRAFLLDVFNQKKIVILFIDEAQKLPNKQLEMVRVLLNIETHQFKLIQIVLAAQMDLSERLNDPEREPLKSRMMLPSYLAPLSIDETKEMLQFRCDQSSIKNPFSEDGVALMYRITNGIPRYLLSLATAAFEMAQIQGMDKVPDELIEPAWEEATIRGR